MQATAVNIFVGFVQFILDLKRANTIFSMIRAKCFEFSFGSSQLPYIYSSLISIKNCLTFLILSVGDTVSPLIGQIFPRYLGT